MYSDDFTGAREKRGARANNEVEGEQTCPEDNIVPLRNVEYPEQVLILCFVEAFGSMPFVLLVVEAKAERDRESVEKSRPMRILPDSSLIWLALRSSARW